ncbi:hypothetical protein BCV72DRAFT_297726 [Rhizopus microsporus var. microsporus]|uniref:Uncharacterized protein n=1 Tax=Rhizopus microsporus var. microsporus TaxID=86635 RepID=A0A1X0QRS1_RHIZD|nr:hypothetical protein BCV72DRAFT_297726 [Rhizopus microsporus var. microsporus]
MRSTIAISAVAVSLFTSAFAANCNPSYNVPGSGECYTNCNIKAGQKFVPGWTMDHTSELFIKSLTVMCDKSGPNYASFMTTAGICMAGCKDSDPEDFNKEFAGACAWWNAHKNDKCDSKTTTTSTTTKTTTTSKAGSTSTSTKGNDTSTATKTGSTSANPGGSSTATSSTTTATVTQTTTSAATGTITSCPTPSSCKSGYRGKRNGKGPEGACCSHSDDCQESCIKGKCNTPIASTCYSGSKGKRRGDGYKNACCKTSDDCWESCVKGKCNGPSLASCSTGYSGKKKGNGPKDACCSSSRDCKESCIKGVCN